MLSVLSKHITYVFLYTYTHLILFSCLKLIIIFFKEVNTRIWQFGKVLFALLYKKNPINMFYFPNRRRSEWDKEGGASIKGKISCHLFLQVVYRSSVTSETLPDYNVESAENSDHVTQGTMGILGITDRGGGTTPHTTTPGSALDTGLPWYKGRTSKNDFLKNPDFVRFIVMISMETLN